ncbi:dephospho-CoA kinase [Propioniciclava soli]|uniref:Dephospho-CoA kinase n=1 Tax=Propioniciclava soli TaxID=2775081 RepID=A0ABZ3C513_9ACTN|nr:dephospho-CoA kinase [Propioniciclava soli]
MKRIVLTGGIASGKSTVADLLAGHGAVVVDADVLAREVVEPGTAGLAEVVARFGEGILLANGGLDRAALARIIFADAAARADLNAIVHPRVRALARERRAAALASNPGAVVVDVIPLLVETGQAEMFDVVVVTDAGEEAQIARLRHRDGLSDADARARLVAQASRAERLAVADLVIDTSGRKEDLPVRVGELWEQLRNA